MAGSGHPSIVLKELDPCCHYEFSQDLDQLVHWYCWP